MSAIELAVFSDDKTAFGIMTDNGLYINTTGHEVDPTTLKPHKMKCVRCGTVFENVTLATVPKPCKCGGIGFETIREEQI